MSARATTLIVDDDPGTCETLADALRHMGHTVHTGHQGRDGLALLETIAIDVAIVDIQLPDISGLELLGTIKRAVPDTEVIIITGYASLATAIAAISGAAFAYLTKPFEMAHLLAIVDKARQKRELVRALRGSEERFRATFEQAAVGLAHNAMDGRWLRVNQRCCDILGYTRDELLARTFLDITHPDELALDHEQLRQFLAGEIRTLSREKRFVHKNGSDVWVDMTVSVARDPVDRSDYFIAVLQDITEKKRLEQELLHAQRMEGVGQLAGGIAHDFNNLLTVISGRSQLALDRMAPGDPRRRDFDLIHKTSARAAALTGQLLAFSRKQVLQPKVLDLNELVDHSTSLLQRLIGEDIELLFVPGADAGRVRVDPGQLEQVIVNLAVNGRDAMPEGGRLTVETANVALLADYAARRVDVAPGPYVMLAVSDTGVGMDRAVQTRIFEPFFTTKGPGHGTGLGLATVYGIVKQSGGHIRVYSEPGRGTVFRIYLPRTDAPVEPASAAAPSALPRGAETVLLVEDESEVRGLAREVLEGLGYTVLEAAVPGDAILIAERHVGLIELLLTDVVMPGMSGSALASRVTAERPETKVLFMSGYTDDAIVRHGVLEPGTSFLEKPFSPQALAMKVREALDRPQ
jgi:two-component system, cell cycle sensor histidine kinase and response regulator CckA